MTRLFLTPIWAAVGRALGARDPDPRVRNPDSWAERLIGVEEYRSLGDHPLVRASYSTPDPADRVEVLTAVRQMIVRTRFIDERLEAAVQRGVTQVVILGAGYDSRAYRLDELLKPTHVFEVDHPDMQEVKRRRVAEVAPLAANVSYVACDLLKDDLQQCLNEAGYLSQATTMFIWEGGTMYFPEFVVLRILKWIATSNLTSCVVFDYTYAAIVEYFRRFRENPGQTASSNPLMAFIQLTKNEPWIFGLPDRQEDAFLERIGLRLVKSVRFDSPEVVRKYLTRADGSVFAADVRAGSVYLILEAAVAGR